MVVDVIFFFCLLRPRLTSFAALRRNYVASVADLRPLVTQLCRSGASLFLFSFLP